MEFVALLVAVIALAVAVILYLKARATEAKSQAAARDSAAAFEQAQAAAVASNSALEQASAARQDSASALDVSARSRQESGWALERAQAAESNANRALEQVAASRDRAGANPEPMSFGPEDVRDDEARWHLEHSKGALWLMRNIGAGVACGALLTDATQPPRYIRPAEVIPRDVAPDDHLQFRVLAGRDAPPPRVRVAWREGDDPEVKTSEATLLPE